MRPLSLTEICGFSDSHIDPEFNLHWDVVPAFTTLQNRAQQAGFDLVIASGFRDFFRQRLIWNNKFSGTRPVLDERSEPVDISALSDIELIHAIMRWSALPGASRHHWGTDCDIYARNLLPDNTQLRLEPWEYEKNGHQYPLTHWLKKNMPELNFFLPYAKDLGGVAREPWHISYKPLAEQAEKLLSATHLRVVLENIHSYLPTAKQEEAIDLNGMPTILKYLELLYSRYIINTDKD